MKLRTFTIIGATGLTLLSAVAGYSASQVEKTVIAQADTGQVERDCMADGIETATGIVGCFQPVIAIVDESFFTTDETVEEEASE